MDSPNFPRDTPVDVTLVARLLMSPVAHKLCNCEQDIFTSKIRVLSHRNCLLQFCEVFSSAYSNKYRKTTIHRLVTKILGHNMCTAASMSGIKEFRQVKRFATL
jgi:hypothetical protein